MLNPVDEYRRIEAVVKAALIRTGTVSTGDGLDETVRAFWIFASAAVQDIDDGVLCEYMNIDRYGYYGGPGQGFSRSAIIVRGKYKTLIYQESGYDV